MNLMQSEVKMAGIDLLYVHGATEDVLTFFGLSVYRFIGLSVFRLSGVHFQFTPLSWLFGYKMGTVKNDYKSYLSDVDWFTIDTFDFTLSIIYIPKRRGW